MSDTETIAALEVEVAEGERRIRDLQYANIRLTEDYGEAAEQVARANARYPAVVAERDKLYALVVRMLAFSEGLDEIGTYDPTTFPADYFTLIQDLEEYAI